MERELHRQEVMRDRERSKESFSRRKMDGGSIPTGPSSTGRTLPRPPPINKRQVAVVSQNTAIVWDAVLQYYCLSHYVYGIRVSEGRNCISLIKSHLALYSVFHPVSFFPSFVRS